MSDKTFITVCMFVGSAIGGYIPSFFGVGVFSLWSILASGIGGVLGVWIGFSLTR